MSNQLQLTGGAKVRDLQDVIIGTSGVLSSVAFDVANGVPRLDSNGKILVSQLPNSVMEYKGTWNAATNTPTLVNGTGNQGDVYLCNVAGTVNFGAGAIAFVVGDQVIYSGSIWQRASGATGTVTSVAVTESGDSLNITGSPITTSGTINIGFNGTNLQYVNGAGNLTTFPILTGFVPYTGATTSVDLGLFSLTSNSIKVIGDNSTYGGTLSIKQSNVTNLIGVGYTELFGKTNRLGISFGAGSIALLSNSILTAERTYTFPDATGTIALTSDIPILTGYVPYTGATTDVDLGAFKLNAQSLHIKGTAGNGHLGLKHQSASATASANEVSLFADSLGDLGWLNGNLYLSKFITSGNTAARSYTFPNATCNIPDDSLVVHLAGTETITGAKTFSGGVTFSSSVTTNNLTFANSGFFLTLQPPTLSVNRTVTLPNGTGTLALTSDISYPVTSVFGRTGAVVATSGDYTTAQVTESGNLYFTDSRARLAISLTTTGTSGASTYNNTTGVLNIPQYADQFVGTVTSVAALTIGTSGTDLSSTVATSTTTPVITLNVPTASASNRGALSSADWTTFNNKQSALTNPVTGTGNNNYIAKFTSTGSTIGNSIISEGSNVVSINGVSDAVPLRVITTSGTASRIGFKTSAAANSYNVSVGSYLDNYLGFWTVDIIRGYFDSSGILNLNYALSGTSASFSSTITAVGYSKFWNGTTGLLIGAFSAGAGYGALYSTGVTPSTTNFALATNGASTVINATNDASIVTNNGNGLVVVGTGNVIINNGTTDSGYKLDVNGTGRFVAAVTADRVLTANKTNNSTLVAGSIEIQSYALNNSWVGDNLYFDGAAFVARNTGYTSQIYFQTDGSIQFKTSPSTVTSGSASNSTPRLTIASTGAATFSSTGSFGNATLNGAYLVVKGANGVPASSGTTTTAVFRVSSGTGLYNVLDFGTNESLDYSWIQSTRANSLGTYDYLAIQPNGGNLLVGTLTNSTYKLDVNGTGRFSGALSGTSASFSGSIVGTGGVMSLQKNGSNTVGSGAYFTLYNAATTDGMLWQLNSSNNIDFWGLTSNSFTGSPVITFTRAGAATFSSSVTAGGVLGVSFASGTGSTINLTNTSSASNSNVIETQYNIYDGAVGLSLVASSGVLNPNIGNVNGAFYWKTKFNGSALTTRFYIAQDGSATFSSTCTATGFFESSDSRLKTLIQDNYQTKGIASITPKLYTKNGKIELGYYAQDFVGILDSAVSKGSDDMLSLSYREVLVAKVYALEQEIKELKAKMN